MPFHSPAVNRSKTTSSKAIRKCLRSHDRQHFCFYKKYQRGFLVSFVCSLVALRFGFVLLLFPLPLFFGCDFGCRGFLFLGWPVFVRGQWKQNDIFKPAFLWKFCEKYLEKQKLILRFGLRGQQKQVKNLVSSSVFSLRFCLVSCSGLYHSGLYFLKLNSKLEKLPTRAHEMAV